MSRIEGRPGGRADRFARSSEKQMLGISCRRTIKKEKRQESKEKHINESGMRPATSVGIGWLVDVRPLVVT